MGARLSDTTVRMIVPFGPGGHADVFGRIIAQKLYEKLGEQFYVENVNGAGGNIGVAERLWRRQMVTLSSLLRPAM